MEFDLTTLVAAIFGGSVVGGIRKLLDWYSSQQEQDHNIDREIRDELRKDIRDLRKSNDRLADEVREVRTRNQELTTELAELKSALVVYRQQHSFLYKRLSDVVGQLNEYKKRAGEEPINVTNWLPSEKLRHIYDDNSRGEE